MMKFRHSVVILTLTSVAAAQAPTKEINLGLSRLPGPSSTSAGSFGMESRIRDSWEVEINGVRFVRIDSGATSLFVPKLDRYSARDFDATFCARNSGTQVLEERVVSRVESRLANSLVAYAGMIADSFRSKCDGTDKGISGTLPYPEIGLSYQPKGKAHETTRYKAFYQPFHNILGDCPEICVTGSVT